MDNDLKLIYGTWIFVVISSIIILPLISSSPALTDNLVSYYKLDEQDTTGSGAIIDSHGSNDGTNTGADNSTGKINTAYDFEEDNSDRIQTTLDFQGTAAFSISMWVKMESQASYNTFWSSDSSAAGCGADALFVDSDAGSKIDFRVAGVLKQVVIEDLTGRWIHIVSTYNSTSRTVWLNGTRIMNDVGGNPTTGDVDFQIGDYNNCDGSHVHFDGIIDEVYISNRSLTEAEILELYNNFDPPPYPFVTDTCTCAGAGNDWEIAMSDYCNITEACDLTIGTLSFTGAGWCNCSAAINTTNLGDPGTDGILWIYPECRIRIN